MRQVARMLFVTVASFVGLGLAVDRCLYQVSYGKSEHVQPSPITLHNTREYVTPVNALICMRS